MADHRANHARAINDLLGRTTSTEDRTETENSVATAIDAAQEFVATGDTASKASKPRLLVDR